MPKPLDAMWVYGEPIQLPNRQILTCNLCGTKIYGGISRLKYHLARMPGFDVGPCLKTTPEIMRIATKSIMDIVDKREANEARRIELAGRSGSGNIGTSGSGGGPQTHSLATGPSTFESAHQPHLSLCRGQHPGGNHLFGHWLKQERRRRPTSLWPNVFFGVTYLSTLPGTPSTIPCLKLLLLLARGIGVLRIMI